MPVASASFASVLSPMLGRVWDSVYADELTDFDDFATHEFEFGIITTDIGPVAHWTTADRITEEFVEEMGITPKELVRAGFRSFDFDTYTWRKG